MNNLKVAVIEFARVRPLTWDPSIVCSKKDREEVWKNFANGFKLPVHEVTKRWNAMRRFYFRELRHSLKEGTKPTWIYFSRLDSFLRKIGESRLKKLSAAGKRADDIEQIEISSSDDSNKGASGLEKGSTENISSKTAMNLVSLFSSPSSFSAEGRTQKSETENAPSTTQRDVSIVKTVPVNESSTTDQALGASSSSTDHSGRSWLKQKTPSISLSKEVELEKKANLPLKLDTTEDIRDELRKIPPIKFTLTRTSPLRPKYSQMGKSSSSLHKRSFSKNIPNLNQKVSKINRLPARDDPTWRISSPMGTSSSNPLTKKSISGDKRVSSLKGDYSLRRKALSLPEIELVNVTSQASATPPIKNNSLEAKNQLFEDKMTEWRDEAKKLPSKKPCNVSDESKIGVIREARKNFLLSFLPDMDEMSSEQRRFFKSKLMDLICNMQPE